MCEVEQSGTTFESLNDSRGFETLDVKLAAAIFKVARGEIGRKLSRLAEGGAKNGDRIKGRQCLWVVKEHFKLDEAAGALYDIADLINVKWQGDNRMELFLSNWESVLCGIKTEPDAATKETLFYEQVRNSSALKYDLVLYEHAEPGHADKSYDFLHKAIRRYLESQQRRANRKQIADALSKQGGSVVALPAQKGKGGKGSGKGGSARAADAPNICWSFRDTGKCAHTIMGVPVPKRKGNGKGKMRSRSNSVTSNASSAKSKDKKPTKDVAWRYFGTPGGCRMGKECPFKHQKATAKAAAAKAKG